jgi:hypothetical protein
VLDGVTTILPILPSAKSVSASVPAARRPEDLVLLLMANAGLVHRTADAAPNAWDRFIHLALDGLRTAAATPGARSPGPAAMRRAMSQRGRDLGFG